MYKARKEGGVKEEKGRAQLCYVGLPTIQYAKIIRHSILLCVCVCVCVYIHTHTHTHTHFIYIYIYIYKTVEVLLLFSLYRVFNLKVDRILIWVIYLLRFTTCYITQLTGIYSNCWKWCPFISMHLSTCFTMFFATFLSVLSFFNHFRNSTFYWRLSSKFFKETLSAVGVRHRF